MSGFDDPAEDFVIVSLNCRVAYLEGDEYNKKNIDDPDEELNKK